MRPAMKLTRKLIGLQWRERSSLSNIFELIDDGLDCLGLHCAFVKLQPVQWPGVHLPRWESGRFQWGLFGPYTKNTTLRSMPPGLKGLGTNLARLVKEVELLRTNPD